MARLRILNEKTLNYFFRDEWRTKILAGNVPPNADLLGSFEHWQLYARHSFGQWKNYKIISTVPHKKANLWVSGSLATGKVSDNYFFEFLAKYPDDAKMCEWAKKIIFEHLAKTKEIYHGR